MHVSHHKETYDAIFFIFHPGYGNTSSTRTALHFLNKRVLQQK
jgi:hypothetical protein